MPIPRQPILQAVLEALGEEDDRIAGQLTTQLTASLLRAGLTATVVTTIGFRPAGKLACEGEVITYTGITPTTFTGLARGQPGRNGVQTLPADHTRIGTPVYDLTRQHSAMDRLRRALIVDFADGRDLDRIGRNYGLPRPKLLNGDDPNYRIYLKRRMYAPAATLNAIRSVLDAAIHGRWGFAVYEDPRRPGEVFVEFSNFPANGLEGKTFLNGSENRTSASLTTVTTAYAPTNVQAVWLREDPNRTGRNYYNLVNTNAQLSIVVPGWVVVPSGLLAGDVGRVLQLRGGTTALTDGPFYRIDEVDLAGNRVRVHALTLGTTGADGVAVPPVEGAMPAWTATEGNVTAEVFHGGSFVASTLTLRGTLPIHPQNLIVDYGAFLSAQVLRRNSIKNDGSPGGVYWPLYLGDGGTSAAQGIVDDLTAAGVIANLTVVP